MSAAILLYVEDNPNDVVLLEALLRREHIWNPLAVAADSAAAAAYLERGERPALVLLDLNLNGADGLEVLHDMRANPATASVPVVVLTISSQQEDALRAFRFGASIFLRKPLDKGQLDEAVRMLGLGWEIVDKGEV